MINELTDTVNRAIQTTPKNLHQLSTITRIKRRQEERKYNKEIDDVARSLGDTRVSEEQVSENSFHQSVSDLAAKVKAKTLANIKQNKPVELSDEQKAKAKTDSDEFKKKQQLSIATRGYSDKNRYMGDSVETEEVDNQIDEMGWGQAKNDDAVFGNSEKATASAKPVYKVKNKSGKVLSVHNNALDAVRARNKVGDHTTHSIIKEESLDETIVDSIKRGVKSIKRGMQGWGGVQGKPSEIVKRNKSYDDKTIIDIHKGLDTGDRVFARGEHNGEHSPVGLQRRVNDREMKKRGLAECVTEESLDESSLNTEQLAKKEEVLKSLKKKKLDFIKRYGKERADAVMQGTATNVAKGVSEEIITELDKKTVKSYLDKADPSQGMRNAEKEEPGILNKEGSLRQYKKKVKSGVSRALARLNVPVKESEETIDESDSAIDGSIKGPISDASAKHGRVKKMSGETAGVIQKIATILTKKEK